MDVAALGGCPELRGVLTATLLGSPIPGAGFAIVKLAADRAVGVLWRESAAVVADGVFGRETGRGITALFGACLRWDGRAVGLI